MQIMQSIMKFYFSKIVIWLIMLQGKAMSKTLYRCLGLRKYKHNHKTTVFLNGFKKYFYIFLVSTEHQFILK